MPIERVGAGGIDVEDTSDGVNVEAAIRAEVTEFIVTNYLFGEVSRTPGDEESLVEAGIVDSTGIVELIEFLESSFGVEISKEETLPQNLGSIASISAFILSKHSGLNTV